MLVEIFAKEDSDRPNKTLIEWFENNLESLIRGGMEFKFTMIKKKEAKTRGIKLLPAAVTETKITLEGTDAIQGFLRKYIKNKTVPVIGSGDPDEDMHKWQMANMSKAAMEAEKEDVDEADDRKKAYQVALREREIANEQFKNNRAPAPKPSKSSAPPTSRPNNVKDDIQNSVAPGDRDGQLIANMFESSD